MPKRAAMIGYAIGRAWWGRGVATEAARAAIAWAIGAFGLARVWASAELGHTRSHRVLEKLGMRRESVRGWRITLGVTAARSIKWCTRST
jgi:RimJ/RimL family protein N-acetyltransferase